MDTRVKDWLTEQQGSTTTSSYRQLRRASAWVVTSLAVVWLALFAISRAFPYIENGAASVIDAKFDLARHNALFTSTDKLRLYAFGNSQMLAGFEPQLFAQRLGPNTAVYNMALPGDDRYVDLLETALKSGNVPTHILVQYLPRRLDESLWSKILDNKQMIKLLVPFRDYIRDLVIFVFEAKGPLGFPRQYRSNAAQISKLIEDHGYYFIKSQSRYPNDELPPDYTMPGDRADIVRQRTVATESLEFKKLIALADKYDFKIIVVPIADRIGAYAQPVDNDDEFSRSLKTYPRIQIAGPVNILMEPHFFSDALHLNPTGAARYTSSIASLTRDLLATK